MITKLQSRVLTDLVQFGFDVTLHSITDRDLIFSIATNDPAWVKDQVCKMCDKHKAARNVYTDLDRVHGYIYPD